MSLVEYFNKGGSMMWLLALVALLATVITIERIITLWIVHRKNPVTVFEEFRAIFEKDGLQAAMEYLAKEKSPMAKILLVGLEKLERGRTVVEEAMTMKASNVLAFLDRGMIYLSASATLAPILGFLGTVTGMIKAFNAIALAGEVEPTLVASGISEALITTATGLLIAAPVALFYAAFSASINGYARRAEEASNAFIEYLLEKGLLKEE